MTSSGTESRGADRWRHRLSSRLWIIAAALGAITVYAMTQVVHATFERRNAAHFIAGSAAMQVANHVAARFESRTTEAFAAVAPWRPASGVTDTDLVRALESLVNEQRTGLDCRCREIIPARAFAVHDVRRGVTHIRPVTAGEPLADTVERVFTAIARATAGTSSSRSAQLHADASVGGDLIVTRAQADADGRTTLVYGLVGDGQAIVGALFRGLRLMTVRMGDSLARARVPLRGDSAHAALWIEVRATGRPDAPPLWLDSSAAGELRSTIATTGALRGLSVTAGMPSARLANVLPVHLQIRDLWMLGALMLATALVTAWALGAAQREASLAHARSDFIAGVSHDLRMPLAQILLAGETLLLRRARSDEERQSLTRSIVRETLWLAALVENVLLFSRSGAVKLAPHLAPVNVTELLVETREGVALAVEDAGQSIDLHESDGLVVQGDRTLLRQALTNLVDNAIKYGKPGQAIVLAAERDVSASRVRLVVQDDGDGIPRDERKRVFEPYARLARDQGSERTGTGLGLSVVRQIADACNGRAWVDEMPGGGTRAVIELSESRGGIA